MNTARNVVLTVAIGADGIAAYPAGGSDSSALLPAATVAQLLTASGFILPKDRVDVLLTAAGINHQIEGPMEVGSTGVLERPLRSFNIG